MRTIDADALKELLIKERDTIPLTKTDRYGFGVELPDPHGLSMRGGINKAFCCMEQTPTIDAVPVVRCGECKYWLCVEDGFGDCTNRRLHLDGCADPSMKMDDFCSCGERRSDE